MVSVLNVLQTVANVRSIILQPVLLALQAIISTTMFVVLVLLTAQNVTMVLLV